MNRRSNRSRSSKRPPINAASRQPKHELPKTGNGKGQPQRRATSRSAFKAKAKSKFKAKDKTASQNGMRMPAADKVLDHTAPVRLGRGLKYHPACLAFPMMGEAELQVLAKDIKQNGQQQPVTTHAGQVLDGKNILAACKLAGAKPRFVEWQGTGSPTEWVVSQNLFRRNLTTSQRAVISLDVLPILEQEARDRQHHSAKDFAKGKASEFAARLVKSNSRYIEAAKNIRKTAPDLIERIRVGELTIPEAMRLAKLSKGMANTTDLGGASTPQWLFDRCNQLAIQACREPLTLDVAAAAWNHKCERYYTEADDGLTKDWDAKSVFCNPPYTADIIELFVRKALQVAQHGTTTVMLIPWWNYPYLDLCEQHGRIHRICGPVTFKRQDGSSLTLNNGIYTSPLVVVVFGRTGQSGFGTPISKSPAPPCDGTTVEKLLPPSCDTERGNPKCTPFPSPLTNELAAVTLPCADGEERGLAGATKSRSYLHGGNASSPRPNTIPTPPGICQFLHDLIAPHCPAKTILDPCAGTGALTKPWGKVKKIDYEILNGTDFFKCPDSIKCDLTLCNPPFNSDDGESFPPEQFFRRILEVVPSGTPIAFIAPMRLRLDQHIGSSRWRWLRDECPAITSIISLPRDVFATADVNSEILLFNMLKLTPHYFVPDKYLP